MTKQGAPYPAPEEIYSVMIGCDVRWADRIVYADGFPDRARHLATEAGVTCLLCPRSDCAQRAHPAVLPEG